MTSQCTAYLTSSQSACTWSVRHTHTHTQTHTRNLSPHTLAARYTCAVVQLCSHSMAQVAETPHNKKAPIILRVDVCVCCQGHQDWVFGLNWLDDERLVSGEAARYGFEPARLHMHTKSRKAASQAASKVVRASAYSSHVSVCVFVCVCVCVCVCVT